MPYGLYLSAAGADAQARRVEIISHNLANANTPGFKRELAVLQARHSEAIEQGIAQPGERGLDDVSGGIHIQETLTDFARGTLQRTDKNTDLAIDDENAFFLVDKDGQAHLTRAGNFVLTQDGQLKTQSGFPVLGVGGAPITIDPSQPWSVDQTGAFTQSGARTLIGLAKPASLGDLVRVGENLFRPLGPLTTLDSPAARPRVLSGHLEQSGIQPATEMMELIEASRAYEANVRMIQNQDHMLGALISRGLTQ